MTKRSIHMTQQAPKPSKTTQHNLKIVARILSAMRALGVAALVFVGLWTFFKLFMTVLLAIAVTALIMSLGKFIASFFQYTPALYQRLLVFWQQGQKFWFKLRYGKSRQEDLQPLVDKDKVPTPKEHLSRWQRFYNTWILGRGLALLTMCSEGAAIGVSVYLMFTLLGTGPFAFLAGKLAITAGVVIGISSFFLAGGLIVKKLVSAGRFRDKKLQALLDLKRYSAELNQLFKKHKHEDRNLVECIDKHPDDPSKQKYVALLKQKISQLKQQILLQKGEPLGNANDIEAELRVRWRVRKRAFVAGHTTSFLRASAVFALTAIGLLIFTTGFSNSYLLMIGFGLSLLFGAGRMLASYVQYLPDLKFKAIALIGRVGYQIKSLLHRLWPKRFAKPLNLHAKHPRLRVQKNWRARLWDVLVYVVLSFVVTSEGLSDFASVYKLPGKIAMLLVLASVISVPFVVHKVPLLMFASFLALTAVITVMGLTVRKILEGLKSAHPREITTDKAWTVLDRMQDASLCLHYNYDKRTRAKAHSAFETQCLSEAESSLADAESQLTKIKMAYR